MKKILLPLFVILMCFSSNLPLKSQINNQYKWLHPTPAGNNLNWVKRWDANNWYAVGGGTTFMKTSTGGNSWTIVNSLYLNNTGEAQYLNDAYFINMNTGLVCGSKGKIIKTTNGGINWNTGIFVTDTTTLWLKLFFLNDNTGYAVGSDAKIAKTTNGGESWSPIIISGLNTHYDVCAKDENNILLGGSSGTIQKTTNGGINWAGIGTGIPGALLRLKIAGGDTVYASSATGGVGISTDFGETWTNITGSLPVSSFTDIDFVTITGTKYAYLTGNKFHIFRAPTGSSTWDSVQFLSSSPSYSDAFTSSDFSVGGDTFITVGYNGFINARYSPSNKVLITKYAKGDETQNDIWADSSTGRVIVAGYPTTGSTYDQIMYSTNGGNNWQISTTPHTDDAAITSISMINSLTGYAGDYNGNSFKTINGGESWTSTSLSGSSDIQEVYFADANTGYVFGNGNYKTTNGGSSWTDYAPGESLDLINGSSFINAATGWTVGENSEVYKTTNGGANVTLQNSGIPPSSTLYDIFMIDGSTGWLAGESGIARKTTNGGTNWSTINLPYAVNILSIHFIDNMNGMATGGLGTVFRTRDGGATWEVTNTSANDEMTQVYMTTSSRAFVCGYSGQVFKYIETGTGIELTFNNTVPSDYLLEQNYPNPFNPGTTIKFGLPRQSTVSIKIYDITGREVASLLNRKMNAGEVSLNFDGSSLASGMYFYSLVVDGEIAGTKKMVLIK